jgi:hypothetical protein
MLKTPAEPGAARSTPGKTAVTAISWLRARLGGLPCLLEPHERPLLCFIRIEVDQYSGLVFGQLLQACVEVNSVLALRNARKERPAITL